MLHEVHTKYQVRFPNLANSEDLLAKTYYQFKNRKKPDYLIDKKHSKDHKDYECKSIQKAFKLKNIKNLSAYDCGMMLVDGSVINDDAYLYFLPRLLKHVLEDPVHENLLSSRLKTLDRKNLSPDETAIIEKIKIVVDEIDKYRNMHEARDV